LVGSTAVKERAISLGILHLNTIYLFELAVLTRAIRSLRNPKPKHTIIFLPAPAAHPVPICYLEQARSFFQGSCLRRLQSTAFPLIVFPSIRKQWSLACTRFG